MQSPFFSIIMPVYNVEKHLRKAVESLLSQEYKRFEIILVDDCSPDLCPGICDEYASRFDFIQVVHHKSNMGLSAARNTGMSYVAGDYVWFMDSDDFVDPNTLQVVSEGLLKNPAQITVFGLIEEYYNEDGSLHHTFSVCPQEYSFSRKEDLRKHIIQLEQKTLYGYAWNKIYSLSYLRKIGLQYENVTLIEDIVFNIKFCENIDSMNILAFTPYHYGKRLDTSLTSKFVPDYFRLHRQRVKMLYEQFTRWNVCTKDTKGKLGAIYVRYIFSAIQRNCDKRSKYSMGMRIRWCRQLFQDELFQGLIPYAAADSLVLKCLIVALRLKSSLMCIGLGRFIYIVKEKTPLIFAKVKQKR